jgi:prepilin-type N-terminal cleavage/methylation domain-containing protein
MKQARGFTLIEMAVVFVVIALLLGSILVPLATQVEQRQLSDTQRALGEIKEALIGFALANGHLPCPDKTGGGGEGIANDGNEDFNAATGACVVSEGNVPWVTLGVGASDPWGNRFRYRVTAGFAQRPPGATFSLTTAGSLTVTCPAPGCNPSYTYTTNAPAVVLSHGRNGLGAVSAATGSANPAPTGTDELENANGNATFVSRAPSAAGATAGEFDDVVTWLSVNILLNRMVAAGKLP